jgi:hypothetical protein
MPEKLSVPTSKWDEGLLPIKFIIIGDFIYSI